ncbi:hypothetical protein MPER_00403 [Moniliophthora perniciosa FA553]|nr:hypothetical protein MPER_00403 [Moniliophthora perniciosa FA553]
MDMDLGHDRLGHASKKVVKLVVSGKCGPGFGDFNTSTPQAGCYCDACIEGKMPQQPYYTSEHRTTKPLELIHMDTCGPMPVSSPHGNLYFHVLLDDYTSANAVVFLRDRSQVPQAVKTVLTRWELLMNTKPINIRCDGSAEQAEGELKQWYEGKGIAVQVTAPYAHAQNGSAERFIRTLEDDMMVYPSLG